MIEATSAGAIALITYCAGLSSHNTISTRSPPSSFDTACTRAPRIPTQAPMGSIRRSFDFTAILARAPGSRAAPMTSISSSAISGTSTRNSSISMSGLVRVKNNCAPRASGRTEYSSARTRSPGRNDSREIKSSRNNTPSALLPKSTTTLSRVAFFTTPVISSPSLSWNCSTTCARSASRTFCTITCLAVWVVIRSKATDSISSSIKSPGWISGFS